jgi:hypothetical protein
MFCVATALENRIRNRRTTHRKGVFVLGFSQPDGTKVDSSGTSDFSFQENEAPTQLELRSCIF